jgi:hypothetical protein
MVDLFTVAIPIIVVGFTVLFILLPRYGPHYTSRLVCPNCKRQFFYHWVPGATITNLRYGNKRHLKCPYCHVQSTFEIAHTRISKPKQQKNVVKAQN